LESYLKEHLTTDVEAVTKTLKVLLAASFNRKAFDELSGEWLLQNLPKDAAREILFARAPRRADKQAIHPTHIHP
jgi:hypothetical protein